MRRKAFVGVVLAMAVTTVVAAMVTPVAAQGRNVRPAQGALLLEGPGSSIGVSIRDVTSEEGEKAKLSQAGGAMVTGVVAGGPGARAGMRPGDLITEFDGERVRGAAHLTRLVRETPPGRAVKSSIVRDSSRQVLEITPESRVAFSDLPPLGPEFERRMRELPRNFSFDLDPGVFMQGGRARLGVALSPLGDQLAAYFGAKRGVLVASVEPDSPAGRAGLKAGDVITSINGRAVGSPADVSEQVRESSGSTVTITVLRDKKETTLQATLPERARPDVPRPSRSRDI